MRPSRPLFLALLSLFAALVAGTALLDVEMALASPSGSLNGQTGAPAVSAGAECALGGALD
ncbi:hypothetical protein FJ251_08665 [bacterium]|nr:hypothetical protein [bacterium]